jgi:hypothetical protein
MSFKDLTLLGLTSIIILLIGSSARFSSRTANLSEEKNREFPPLSILQLKDGDVILRKGNSVFSELIARNFPAAEGMSHCGFIFKIDDQYQVIHTISKSLSDIDGIRINTLEEFVQEAKQNRICIIRYHKKLNSVSMKARCLVLLKQKIPFDNDFDLNDSSRLYCSELLRKCYLEQGEPDFFQLRKIVGVSVIDFATFFNPELFTTVYKNY